MADTHPKRTGAGRHLKIIGALVLVATVLFIVTRLDSIKAKLSDMAAVTEGRDAAERLTAPDSLLAYILRHPEQASLVAFDTDAPEEGLFVEADAEHPGAGLPTLLLAAVYAEGVADGCLDPDESVPYENIAAFTLPAIEGDRHLATLVQMGLADTLEAEGEERVEEVVTVQPQIPLRRVVEAAVRHGDRPSADYLTLRFDRRAVRRLLRDNDATALAPPVPTSGLYLAWTPTHRGATVQERLDGFLTLTDAAQADTAFAVAERLRDDDTYRVRERERLRFESLGMTVDQQRTAAQSSFPVGTARGYADLLARIATGAFESDSVSTLLHSTMGNPVEPFAALIPGAEVRGKGGGFTGIYALAAYAHRPDGTARVAVLLMHDVPTAVFIETGRQALDQGLIAGLLGSDAFFEQARSRASVVAR